MKRHKITDKRKDENKAKFSDITIGDYFEDDDTIVYLKTSKFGIFDIKNGAERVIEDVDIDKLVTPLDTVLQIHSSK